MVRVGVLEDGRRRGLDGQDGQVGRRVLGPDADEVDRHAALAEFAGLVQRRQAPVVLAVGQDHDAEQLAFARPAPLDGPDQRLLQVGEGVARRLGVQLVEDGLELVPLPAAGRRSAA